MGNDEYVFKEQKTLPWNIGSDENMEKSMASLFTEKGSLGNIEVRLEKPLEGKKK